MYSPIQNVIRKTKKLHPAGWEVKIQTDKRVFLLSIKILESATITTMSYRPYRNIVTNMSTIEISTIS